ncbi:molybdopterin-dependent oxidoreductase [Thermomicrobium sp. 4228-Ro]|uniref:molybdopterin-dependent oxidoreductase n=1 Tax=Thermomicrobium sp. 4228-Ro TaxID=2993937 RepID=UPI002248B7F8|nr:molybdopterin-dependent oxidoreductase [Thermomicrobium sp. 4228-Ro]MCX2727541.1 molybdopterin-dependent oxidoreductase [Thermomicrobium sp. 4228-Ro]
MRTLPTLPEFPVPESTKRYPANPRLHVYVGARLLACYRPDDLAPLERFEVTMPFVCSHGWQTPPQRWSGLSLRDLLWFAKYSGALSSVVVGAGDSVVILDAQEAARALLCDRLNGEPLPPEHGGPWRSFVPEAACTTSVKWVDRIILLEN